MKRYWDASALIDALHDSRIEQKALEPGQCTRPHALAETFATLTGGRLGFCYLPDDAAALIRELTQTMNFVELEAKPSRHEDHALNNNWTVVSRPGAGVWGFHR